MLLKNYKYNWKIFHCIILIYIYIFLEKSELKSIGCYAQIIVSFKLTDIRKLMLNHFIIKFKEAIFETIS